jgi:hypothetical protein
LQVPQCPTVVEPSCAFPSTQGEGVSHRNCCRAQNTDGVAEGAVKDDPQSRLTWRLRRQVVVDGSPRDRRTRQQRRELRLEIRVVKNGQDLVDARGRTLVDLNLLLLLLLLLLRLECGTPRGERGVVDMEGASLQSSYGPVRTGSSSLTQRGARGVIRVGQEQV